MFTLGENILPGIIYMILESGVETPKLCASNGLSQSSEQTTIPTPLMKSSQDLKLAGHIDGPVQSVFTTGSYAYVSIGSEMAVLDLTDTAHPKLVGSLRLPAKATDIYVEGHYVYAAVGEWGIRIIDVSNPTVPSEVGSYRTPVSVDEVIVSKGYAYFPLSACNGGGELQPTKCTGALQIVDVSNPTNPVQVGCHEIPRLLPTSMAIDGDYTYISGLDYGRSKVLRIMDISDPTMVSETNTHDTTYMGALAVADDYAYVATGYHKLQILNVSNPRGPTEAGLYDSLNAINGPQNEIYNVAVLGKYAYLAIGDMGIQVLDISDSAQPLPVGAYNMDGRIKDIAIMGNIIYVATDINGLQIIDVTNPSVPLKIGAY
jgi:hypothetical protein